MTLVLLSGARSLLQVPTLQVAPLVLVSVAEGTTPEVFQVTVQNIAGGVLPTLVLGDIAYQDGDDWLSLSLVGEAIAGVIDPTGLLPGTYDATRQVRAPGANGSPITVTVRATVATLPVTIQCSNRFFADTAEEGGTAPAPIIRTLFTPSGALDGPTADPVSYTPGSGTGWVETPVITPVGDGTYDLEVALDQTGLSEGPVRRAVFVVRDAASSTGASWGTLLASPHSNLQDTAANLFEDPAADDYRLKPAYQNTADDGTDAGADIDWVLALTAGVRA